MHLITFERYIQILVGAERPPTKEEFDYLMKNQPEFIDRAWKNYCKILKEHSDEIIVYLNSSNQ